ncbi:hypothetical protein QAD02_016676 [Eretmocerus hayati]|uniref:Uncharacterized protein n=1 Tax=Eretmocerus hayati TaxID=131215 RepID=A0ACC2PBA8_9HYME|nr:hypothetical protein QAD02_016676 [Eretmocerus hayati]
MADNDRDQTSESVHSWLVQFPNFASLPHELGKCTTSLPFSIGSHMFKIQVYPGGLKKYSDSKGYVGLFLGLSEFTMRLKIKYKLSILINGLTKYSTDELSDTLTNQITCCGYSKVVSRDALLKDLYPSDKLVVLCEIYGLDTKESTEKLKMYTKLENFLNDQDFSDVTLVVEGKKLYAHRIILSNGSDVFAAMLKEESKEKMPKIIEIEDFDHDVILELLRFLYGGKVNCLELVSEKLLIAADKYGVSLLKNLCEKYLCSTLTIENVLKMIMFSDCFKLEKLFQQSLLFFRKHKTEVTGLKEFGLSIKKMDPPLIAKMFTMS